MVDELLKRIERLEYHQRLMVQILNQTDKAFTKLIVMKNMGQEEVMEFHALCDYLSKKWEEQKAEGFLNYHPLLEEFSDNINRKLEVKETITACLQENLYPELMVELKKYS